MDLHAMWARAPGRLDDEEGDESELDVLHPTPAPDSDEPGDEFDSGSQREGSHSSRGAGAGRGEDPDEEEGIQEGYASASEGEEEIQEAGEDSTLIREEEGSAEGDGDSEDASDTVSYSDSSASTISVVAGAWRLATGHATEVGQRVAAGAQVTNSPQGGIKPSFLGPCFVLALAGIRRLVVQIKAIKNNRLAPL